MSGAGDRRLDPTAATMPPRSEQPSASAARRRPYDFARILDDVLAKTHRAMTNLVAQRSAVVVAVDAATEGPPQNTSRSRTLRFARRPLAAITDEASMDRTGARFAACLRPRHVLTAYSPWSEHFSHSVRRTSRLATTTCRHGPFPRSRHNPTTGSDPPPSCAAPCSALTGSRISRTKQIGTIGGPSGSKGPRSTRRATLPSRGGRFDGA